MTQDMMKRKSGKNRRIERRKRKKERNRKRDRYRKGNCSLCKRGWAASEVT